MNINKYLIPTTSRKWNWGLSTTFKILNLGEVAIVKLTPLKQDRNPYVAADQEYFLKRRQTLIDAKFRALMYRIYKHVCPICHESLHNGELVELHHIIPRKSGGKYSIENILPLHQICHQQATHGNRSLERLRIALTPAESKKKGRKAGSKKSKGNAHQSRNLLGAFPKG